MSLKYSILGLLHYRDMHGYRIKEHIERNFGHMWSINFGQIYPNLKKMYQENLISMEQVVQAGVKGPPRKLYSITQKGRDEFQNWLSSLPEKEMLLRDPFLMRFVFFGFGNPKRSLEIIEGQIRLYEKQKNRRLQNHEKWKQSDIYVSQIVVLGIKMNEMMLNWLKETYEKIKESIE